MPYYEPLPPDENSKSRRKKEMLDLQKLGESLVKLTETQLKTIPLQENLLIAVQHARNLKAEAMRRQMQYIGKLMRDVDAEPIKAALKKIQMARENKAVKFQETEKWRAKLISNGDEALNVFVSQYPEVDRQQLRQLIRKAVQDQKKSVNTGAEKALFKYLRTIVKEE